MRKLLLIFSLLLTLSLLPAYGCSPEQSQAESLELARNYIINAPTYKFDGMDGSLKFISSAPTGQNGWEFTFEFTSRQSGYGDRKGQILLQVLTPHRARIQVVNGKVTAAVLDERWDELNQKML